MGQQDTPENSPERTGDLANKPDLEESGRIVGALSLDQAFQEPQTSAPEEEVQALIDWAESVYDGFDALPETNPVKAKKQRRRDEKFVDKALAGFAGGERGHIVDDPESLSRSLEVWSMWSEEYEGRGEEFVQLVHERLYEYGRRNWRDIGKETLAGLAQELAHSPLAEEGLQSTLRGYFEGPGRITDHLQAHLKMTLSAKHVLNDQKAIDKITEIVCFKTPVMEFGSPIYKIIAADGADYTYLGLEEARLNFALDRTRQGLSRLSTYGQDVANAVNDLEQEDTTLVPAGIRAFIQEFDLSVEREEDERNVESLIHERQEILKMLATVSIPVMRERLKEHEKQKQDDSLENRLYKQVVVDWAKEFFAEPNPYITEFNKAFGTRWFVGFIGVIEKNAIKDIISIPTEDGIQLDIHIPDEETSFDEQAIQSVLLQYSQKMDELKKDGDERWVHLIASRTDPIYEHDCALEIPVEIDSKEFTVTVRNQCELDKLSEHELNKLMMADIPDIEGEGFETPAAIWERIQNAEEERYVSKRGFKVDFVSEGMLEAGLQSIAFKQDPKRLQHLIVTLDFKGEPISYRLDKRGNLDLENKQIYSSKLVDLIHRRTLAVLEHYMGREVLEAEGETALGPGETGTIARPARVVFLPEGHNFSEEARAHYLIEQGKDLKVRSEERRLYNWRSRDRNSTYRRATEVDDPSLDPIEIKIDNPDII